jgi:hypothetical protein
MNDNNCDFYLDLTVIFLFSVFSNFEKIRYCPHFVRTSVDDSTPQGIDRPRSFRTQSISYGPRTCTKEGIFCRTRPRTRRDILVQISLYFHVKIGFPIIIQDWKGDQESREFFRNLASFLRNRKRFAQVLYLYPAINIYPLINL